MVLQPNIPGVWEDLRKLGLALVIAALIGGFLQNEIGLTTALGGATLGVIAWGSGILFGGGAA